MIRQRERRRDPGDRRELARVQVGDELVAGHDVVPHRAEPHVTNHPKRLHPLVRSAVLLPRDAGRLEPVGEHRDVGARPASLPIGGDLRGAVRSLVLQLVDLLLVGAREGAERERSLERIVAELALADAELAGSSVVDEPVGLCRERPQVLDPGRPVDRAEELVGQGEVLRVGPVVRDLVLVELHVADIGEAVHLAAVDRRDAVGEAVPGGEAAVGRPFERHGRPVACLAGRRAVRTGERAEVVVERPVLFDHEHDVFDLAAREGDERRVARGRGRHVGGLARIEHGGHAAAATARAGDEDRQGGDECERGTNEEARTHPRRVSDRPERAHGSRR